MGMAAVARWALPGLDGRRTGADSPLDLSGATPDPWPGACAPQREDLRRYEAPELVEALTQAVLARLPVATAAELSVTPVAGALDGLRALLLSEAPSRVVTAGPCFPGYALLCGAASAGLRRVPISALEDPGLRARHSLMGARLLLINTPHNPSGWVFSVDALDALLRMRPRGCLAVIDAVYSDGIRGYGASLAGLSLRHPNVLILESASKAFGLPGLRLGWIISPRRGVQPWRARVAALQALSLPAPWAIRWVGHTLPELASWSASQARAHQERSEPFARRGLLHPSASGAMPFVWVRAASGSGVLIARRIRESMNVLVSPGELYGAPGRVRVGLQGAQIALAELAEGLERERLVYPWSRTANA